MVDARRAVASRVGASVVDWREMRAPGEGGGGRGGGGEDAESITKM